mmetsp:Transcript_6994/g.28969  ORF Transcript_6994/g.28969 Transcript_6994/m.28969 type:complete len:256 (-) Transcript_6994:477-1244(-)
MGAPPYSSRISSVTDAATPPNPPRSSAKTWNPRSRSHSSAQYRTASLASSLRSSDRHRSTPSPKPANASTPDHNPGSVADDRGWRHALQKSVHDLASSASVEAEASSAAARRFSSSPRPSRSPRRRPRRPSVTPTRSWAVIFARSAAMASTSPPFLDRFVDPPHLDRRAPSSSSSSSSESSVSIRRSGSSFSACDASSFSSSSSPSKASTKASSSRLRRKADLCACSCLNTAWPPSQLVIGGRFPSASAAASSSP